MLGKPEPRRRPLGPMSLHTYGGGPRIYAARPAAPAAIIVLLPSIGAEGSQYVLARDPTLWAAQGFDVVMPQPAEIYRSIVDQQATLARLFAAGAPTDLAGRCGSGY